MKKQIALIFIALFTLNLSAGLRYLTPLKSVSSITDVYSLLGDGVNKYVDFGNNFAFERTDAFTVEIWYNRDSNSASLYPLWSKRNAAQSRGYYFAARPSLNQWVTQLSDSSSNTIDVRGNFTWGATTWYQVIEVYTGNSTFSGVTVYINATAQTPSSASGTLTSTMVTTDPLTIFKDGSASVYTPGKMDWFRIWNRALSAGEVTTLYNSGKVFFNGGSGVVGFWPIGKTPEWTDTTSAINPYVGSVVGTPNNFVSGDFAASIP